MSRTVHSQAMSFILYMDVPDFIPFGFLFSLFAAHHLF